MGSLPIIHLSRSYHRNADRFLIAFKYDTVLVNLVKSLPSARWSSTLKSWYVTATEKNLKAINNLFRGKAFIEADISLKQHAKQRVTKPLKNKLSETQRTCLNAFYLYLMGKRYSKSTVNSYTFLVADFVAFNKSKKIAELNGKDVRHYLESVYLKYNYSISKQRLFISALKAFKQFMPELAIDDLKLTRPKRSRRLPIVLSQEEIIRIIQVTKNLKHRAIIALLYSCGLRISELINLKLEHISIDRRQLTIKNGKGRKDRYVILAESYLPLLKNYLNSYTPLVYFCEGSEGQKYADSSVRKFLSRSCEKAGLRKRVTPHTLRHSYATHLLENGIDIRYIQELLGHAKPETTMIYTHVAKKDLLDIKSPLDVAVNRLMDSGYNTSNVHISGK